MNNLKLVLFLLLLSSWAFAQGGKQADSMPSPGPDSTTTCEFFFSSGSGPNLTKFCVTENGNIAQFSVGGHEMIQVNQVGEGYGICDPTTFTRYFDYAYTDSGNWLASTFSQRGNVVTVTRETSDGIWQLKQTITNIPATATGPGSAKIVMAVKNLSGVDRDPAVIRFADIDADGLPDTNNFDYTSQTAMGLNPEGLFAGHGLAITNFTFFTPAAGAQSAFAQSTYEGPDPCSSGAKQALHPFTGDGSVVMLWGFLAPHGKSVTVTSVYKPI